jgi:hypothetical protein
MYLVNVHPFPSAMLCFPLYFTHLTNTAQEPRKWNSTLEYHEKSGRQAMIFVTMRASEVRIQYPSPLNHVNPTFLQLNIHIPCFQTPLYTPQRADEIWL